MSLNYKFIFEDDVFKYNCSWYCSYLKGNLKKAKEIYEIFKRLNVIHELARKTETDKISYNGFTIVFNCRGDVKIKGFSNWLSTKEEVPIIERELRQHIERCVSESIKDIIVGIKSLKKGAVIK